MDTRKIYVDTIAQAKVKYACAIELFGSDLCGVGICNTWKDKQGNLIFLYGSHARVIKLMTKSVIAVIDGQELQCFPCESYKEDNLLIYIHDR